MILIAECYANKCFSLQLRRRLIESGIQDVKVRHKQTIGRDRILRDIVRITDRKREPVIAVIDYEKGVARTYIDKQFYNKKFVYNNIFIGTSSRRNILAIIFDPNIEESLLCRIDKTLCTDKLYYDKIKSMDACKILSKYLNNDIIRKLLDYITKEIINMLDQV